MTQKTQSETKPRNPRYSSEREERVAAALRENLRKRKVQQMQRTTTLQEE